MGSSNQDILIRELGFTEEELRTGKLAAKAAAAE